MIHLYAFVAGVGAGFVAWSLPRILMRMFPEQGGGLHIEPVGIVRFRLRDVFGNIIEEMDEPTAREIRAEIEKGIG